MWALFLGDVIVSQSVGRVWAVVLFFFVALLNVECFCFHFLLSCVYTLSTIDKIKYWYALRLINTIFSMMSNLSLNEVGWCCCVRWTRLGEFISLQQIECYVRNLLFFFFVFLGVFRTGWYVIVSFRVLYSMAGIFWFGIIYGRRRISYQ